MEDDMGSLEDKEIAATNKVVKKLNAQAKRIQAWLPTGNPTMVGRINAAIIWVFVSRTLLENLAIAANGKALSAVTAGANLREAIKTVEQNEGSLHAETEAADRAQQMLSQSVADQLKAYQDVLRFDQAVALKVWASHRQALALVAGAKDLAGLRDAIAEIIRIGIGTALGVEFVKTIFGVLGKFKKRKLDAKAGSDLLDFVEKLSEIHIRWSLQAQCQIYRLKSEHSSLTEDQLMKQARTDVMEIFKEHWKRAQ